MLSSLWDHTWKIHIISATDKSIDRALASCTRAKDDERDTERLSGKGNAATCNPFPGTTIALGAKLPCASVSGSTLFRAARR